MVPDPCWRRLYYWYTKITAQVKWDNYLSKNISILKGTRQGGICWQFLFNIYYQDLVQELSRTVAGVNIDNCSYNTLCYADDVLLANPTVTGLQKLIDVAENYIKCHGLRFNPLKTQCIIYGKQYFVNDPTWPLDITTLTVTSEITYLGATLSNNIRIMLTNGLKPVEGHFILSNLPVYVKGEYPRTQWLIYGRLQSSQFFLMPPKVCVFVNQTFKPWTELNLAC